MVGGVGQRMLASVSRRMAGEFFGNVDAVAHRRRAGRWPTPGGAAARPTPGRCLHRTRHGRRRSARSDDFLKGIAVGAGLVLLGVRRSVGLRRRREPVSDLTSTRTRARAMASAVAPAASISARELLDLHLARIAERNPELNAIVVARRGAGPAGAARGRRAPRPRRPGRPAARPARSPFKDTHDVAGWRTTYGSPLFADHVPDADDLIVERIRRGGRRARRQDQRAGVRGRVPHVQPGLRHHPQPASTRAGPPAGPAAERPARWPPGWCRSPTAPTWAARCATRRRSAAWSGCGPRSAGCPTWPTDNQWETTSVGGPMARNVGDLALLLSVIAGPDPRVPLALGDPGRPFAPPLAGSLAGLRVACSADLGGALEVDHEVAAVVEGAGAAVRAARRTVFDGPPRPALADDTFRTLRAWHFQATLRRRCCAEHPDAFKPSLADNIRAGEALTGADVARAFEQRTALAEPMRAVLRAVRRAGAAGLAGAAVPGRPGVPARRSTAGRWRPTSTGCARRTSSPSPAVPAISVPAGSTPDGLPVGHADRRAARRGPAAAGGRGGVRGCGGGGQRQFPPPSRGTFTSWGKHRPPGAGLAHEAHGRGVQRFEHPNTSGIPGSLLTMRLETPGGQALSRGHFHVIESVGESTIRIAGTDLDVTIRCDMDAGRSQRRDRCVCRHANFLR